MLIDVPYSYSLSYLARFTDLLVSFFSTSIFIQHYHFSILLAAMDLISRYQSLLLPLDSLHYQILAVFMKGLNANRERVRERAVNLLARFVSGLKQSIIPFQQGILDVIQGLIVLPTPDDLIQRASEPLYYEGIYPLFFITSTIICGNWNSIDEIYGFYHVPEIVLFLV